MFLYILTFVYRFLNFVFVIDVDLMVLQFGYENFLELWKDKWYTMSLLNYIDVALHVN
jgi:hypothetical protein